MKKILSITLVLAMLFSALLGVTSFAADEEPAKLDIKSANIEFASTVYLLIAVDYTGVYATEAAALAGVKLTVNGTELTPDAALTADESTPDNTVAFKYTKLSAQEMGDELEIKAFKGDEEQDSLWYSVLEYALKVRDTHASDALLMTVIDTMMAFGAEAQKVFLKDGETVATKYDYDLTKNHSLAKLVGGATFAGGRTKTILEEGAAAVTATHADYTDSAVWYNTKLQVRGNEPTLSLTYNGKSETYFAAPASIAANNALDMDTYTSDMYYYGIEYTSSYSSSKYNNATQMYVVKDGESKLVDGTDPLAGWGIDWWLAGSSIPSGGKTADAKYGGYAIDYSLSSPKFTEYLKEQGVENADSLTLAEKWEKKNSNDQKYYTIFVTAAQKKVHTLDEVIANSTAYVIFDADGGYIKCVGNQNFNSSKIAGDVYKAVGAYANGDANAESCFTLTITLAGDGQSKAPFTFFSLRNNNHKSGGGTTPIFGTTNGTRLGFLYSANATNIRAVYTSEATDYKTGSVISKLDRTDVAVGSPTEFQTFYIVFDLAKKEMRYYLEGDIDTPVAVSAMPEALNVKTFFGTEALPYFNGQIGGGYIGYLKTFSVTGGDITKYMQ